jgi:RimJ/RimL family protein N-acetyltransferase
MDENAGSEIDLAYHFARASWNKGYATEAAIAVLTQGLGPIGLDSIMAVVVPENVGSFLHDSPSGCATRASRTTTGSWA